jgi:hypothetical protein
MTDRSVVHLSRFQADVSRALARRAERLLESRDVAAEVQKLQPLEAYLVIKEVGVHDAGDLLKYTTPEQLQAFVDLDCWSGDELSVDDIDAWLAPFQSDGREELARAFLRLDDELQTLFLASIVNLYDTREEDSIPDAPESVVRRTTADGYFVVEPIPSEVREVDPLVLIDGLYAVDIDGAFALLTSARWELRSNLEEEAYRFRNGRLEDMGFLTRSEALRLFAAPPARPPSSRHASPEAPATALPALYAAPLRDKSLLARAMARVTDERLLSRLEEELVLLINGATVAYGESPRDLAHVTEIATRVRDTLSLGLEALISPNGPMAFPDGEAVADDAAKQLALWPMADLFRWGIQETLPLARLAQSAAAEPVIAHWLEQTDDSLDRVFMKALLATPPLYAGFDLAAPRAVRAFGTKRELAEAMARLDALAKKLVS